MLLSVGLYFLLAIHSCAAGDTSLKDEILQEMRLMLSEFQVRSVCRTAPCFNILRCSIPR